MTRINRLYRIVNILMSIKNQPGILVEEISSKCGVSISTIYRDISILEAVGVPISHEGGLRLTPGLFIPSISLTLNEANTIKDACYLMLEKEHNNEVLNHIIEKLSSSIYLQNSPLYTQNKNLFANIEEYLKSGKIEKIDQHYNKEKIELLKNAIIDECYIEALVCVEDKDDLRVIHPISLFFQKDGWYLLGAEKGAQNARPYKLSILNNIKVSNTKVQKQNITVDYKISHI